MRLSRFFLFSTLPLLLTGCFFGDTNESQSESSFVDEDDYYLHIEEANLNYVFVGADPLQYVCAVYKNSEDVTQEVQNDIVWSSSNPDIITVSGGLVTAVSDGDAILKATYQGIEDETTIHARVFADSFSIQEDISIHLGETFDIPYEISPSNASILFEIEDETILKIEDSKFVPLKEETAYMVVTVYRAKQEDEGDPYTNFAESKFGVYIHIGPDHHPYFTFNDAREEEGEISVPKNKYSSLDLPSFGLAAYTYDGQTDISNEMSVVGDYHLDEVGEYPLTINITNESLTSSFALTLIVTAYELKELSVDESDLSKVLSYNVEAVTDAGPYSTTFRKVGFTATFAGINYDDYQLNISVSVHFTATNYDTGATVSKSSRTKTCTLVRGQASTSVTCDPSFVDENHYDYLVDSFHYTPDVVIEGKVFTYIYY